MYLRKTLPGHLLEAPRSHFSPSLGAAQRLVCPQLLPGLHAHPSCRVSSPREANPHLPHVLRPLPPLHPPLPHSPAQRPHSAHVNDSNKYLIKAPGDAARQSPLLSRQEGWGGAGGTVSGELARAGERSVWSSWDLHPARSTHRL